MAPAVDSLILLALLATAAVLRLVLFTGFFGSDEVVYSSRALDIVNSTWQPSDYIGAIRYGMNLPVAAFVALFGVSEFSLNLWTLTTSLGEVALVYLMGRVLWGRAAAVLAAVVLIVLPLHLHLAGRLMPDPPIGFFISLSFVLFYLGERRGGVGWYLFAGLAAGFVFWIKEVVVIYAVVFVLYALFYRIWRWRWLWAVAGVVAMVAANSALMWVLFGDPLYVFDIVRGTVDRAYLGDDTRQYGPGFYFHRLFFDIRHVWIVGYLALAGVLYWLAKGRRDGHEHDTGFVVIWLGGLLALFSFFAISFSPLTLIAKQTNYMTIFFAPLSLMAGYAMAQAGIWLRTALLVVLIPGALVLAALEQQAVQVFVANTKAALVFAREHRDAPVYGSHNAISGAIYLSLLNSGETPRDLIRAWKDMRAEGASADGAVVSAPAAYVVVDPETMSWGRGARPVSEIPDCWREVARLEPSEFGIGATVIVTVKWGLERLPHNLAAPALALAERLMRPATAVVYAVPAGCGAVDD